MISIQTNVNSLVAQQNLSVNTAFQSKTIAQLTSGYRINQSGDDAAGLAVANKFRSTVAELTQGVANGNDATAQLQIMDGGMSNISSILDRLKTLATQSASGTFTGNRTTLNSEFQNDLAEIDRQAQSVGLNTGGSFAKNLDVYLGQGSGSSSLQNGVVTLALTASSVDSQSLGMKGMQAVNATYAADGTNGGTNIGSTSLTSVQNIVGNSTNQEATAGYAAFQFSGAGFSDAGKVQASANLTGVTDVTTLAAALNSAIKAAGDGNTAAATAFKNANIVASVHTDSTGGQQLAFSSSTSAFQVQAGDQMANALLGHVTGSGVTTLGVAVSGTSATTVTGAVTTDGALAQGQTVKVVVTGGGLAGPVTLNVNTAGAAPVTTSGAITDLETQFSGNAPLAAAGLTMTGSATPGGQLSFKSASGQSFNIQVTGDSANLLGLGSFLADSAGNADYTKITAGAAYDAMKVTGSSMTTGVADGLEVSLNGSAATALAPIDLNSGAHAVAASLTSDATIGANGAVDITPTAKNLDITVINNGVVNHQTIGLAANQVLTKATVASGIAGMVQSAFAGYTASAAGLNDQFTIALDGGAAKTITLDSAAINTFTADAAGAANFLTALQNAINTGIGGAAGQVLASWALDATGAATGALTLTSATSATGVTSSISLGVATTATKGSAASTTLDSSLFPAGTLDITANNNHFKVSFDGGAEQTVTLAIASYTGASAKVDFLADVQAKLNTSGIGSGNVTASWGAFGGSGSGKLTLTDTSGTTGAGSTVAISAFTYGTKATTGSTTLASTKDFAGTPVVISAANHNNSFNIALDGGASVKVTLADNTYSSSASFLAEVNNAIDHSALGTGAAGSGTVKASWGTLGGAGTGALTFTDSVQTGVASTLTISAAKEATSGTSAGTAVKTGFTPFTSNAGTDSFMVAVDGNAAIKLTVDQAGVDADALVIAINAAIVGTSGLNGKVQAGWDAVSGKLTLTSLSSGSTSSVDITQDGANTGVTAFFGTTTPTGVAGANSATNAGLASVGLSTSPTVVQGVVATDGGLGKVGLSTTPVITAGNPIAPNTGLATAGLVSALTRGHDDAPTTVQSIADAIQTRFGSSALVTVSNDNKISIAATTKGTNSSVILNDTVSNAYGALHLTSAVSVSGQNSSITDVVDNLNAQFAAAPYQAAGLKAVATKTDGTVDTTASNNTFISIQSGNGTQFRLNAVGAPAVATAAAVASTVTDASISTTSAITITANTNDKFNVSVGAGAAQTLTVGPAKYVDATAFLNAVKAAITASNDPTTGLAGKVTAGWDAATRKLTLTSVATGTAASVTTSAVSSNTGLATFGFGTGGTNSGQLFSGTENTGFGVAGSSFTGAAASSTGTAISTLDAYGISNSGALSFQAMQLGTDKQALTFSATDAAGALETKTITLENNASTNRAGRSIDDAVAFINQQLQQSTSNPALQHIVAVKENAGSGEKINFVSSLNSFTLGVAGTGSGSGLNAGAAVQATQVKSTTNGSGANMSIDTQAGAMAAITAIATAVGKLGTAQAAVGKGQNQLTYAISLAQSQITNFSAAESQIRDANVAQQAANLSKAQTLSQASIAAMAQANSAPQAVLSLLRG